LFCAGTQQRDRYMSVSIADAVIGHANVQQLYKPFASTR
jgi:hypothetical protein